VIDSKPTSFSRKDLFEEKNGDRNVKGLLCGTQGEPREGEKYEGTRAKGALPADSSGKRGRTVAGGEIIAKKKKRVEKIGGGETGT